MSISPVRLAISLDFLDAFSKLPKQIQHKTHKLIDNFQKNPQHRGLNYESIRHARDPYLKSLRVDQTYRAIVRQPEQGHTYILLWIDHHDLAYNWAQNRLCKINPESGAVQIIDLELAKSTETEINQRYTPDIPRRFQNISNRNFLRLGVPEEFLEAVRSVVTDEDIDQLLPQLPEEAADAIVMLGAGYALEKVLEEHQKKQTEYIDTSNLETALNRDDSKRRFYVVENESDLLAMLTEPLEKWRVFLHPSQRRLVEKDWKGPVRVLGGAGTGKTVVAMHRAKWLAQHRFNQPEDLIFLTTFSKNLAIDIEMNLRKICSPEIQKRIHVENIDSWVSNFLKKEGITNKIAYDDQVKALWQKVYRQAPSSLSLSLSFYQDEWKKVIQAHNILTLKDYLAISRVGRGTSLQRTQRVAVWSVFAQYRALLQEEGFKEFDDALREAYHLLQGKSLPFRSIIVDEAQDMSEGVFRLLLAMVGNSKNNLFIVGDPHQRIYSHQVVLSRCGIEIRGRSRKLRINYRTTQQIGQWARSILQDINFDDLDGRSDNLTDYHSLLSGEEPLIQGFSSQTKEIKFLQQKIKQISNHVPLESICLVLRTNYLIEIYQQALEKYNILTYKIRPNEADYQSLPGLRITTMHRVKGLQFEYIFLPCLNQDILPLEKALKSAPDLTTRENLLNLERSLLYVAATRAKQLVTISYYGKPSPFLYL
ncbi:MAG: DNA helicase [Gloeocapsa sp. DLM2.Bin57]|nr:MAG: DNA helicase [Gloeocapsa sp. DLM2.Bin57]